MKKIAIIYFLYLINLSIVEANLPDFTTLVAKNSPAVVNISTTQNHGISRSIPDLSTIPELRGNPLAELLKRYLDGMSQGNSGYQSHSRGSGFIISSDGYIVTNHHVVENVDEILIKLNDQREFKGRVIGSDKNSDIALIKINAKNLPFVKVGNSKALKAGEWVLAIGSPFGYDSSVTAGIVSAKRRTIPGENYIPFIQTDVAINPGNSGGPLFNLKGEVVGVNSQIYSKSGGYMGISFSVPIEMAMNVVQQIKSKGRVARGWLGLYIQDVPKDLITSFGLNRARGALIGNTIANSPAEKAGLERGDIILSYDQNPIEHSADLPPFVGNTPVGQKIPLKVLRHKKKITLFVTIEELPDNNKPVALMPRYQLKQSNSLGLSFSAVTEAIRSRYQLRNTEGVYIDKITQGAAQDAGIKKGDVIVMFDNQKVMSPTDFYQKIQHLPVGKTLAVLIVRQSGSFFVPLHIPE